MVTSKTYLVTARAYGRRAILTITPGEAPEGFCGTSWRREIVVDRPVTMASVALAIGVRDDQRAATVRKAGIPYTSRTP